jgi:hypothetical protein
MGIRACGIVVVYFFLIIQKSVGASAVLVKKKERASPSHFPKSATIQTYADTHGVMSNLKFQLTP